MFCANSRSITIPMDEARTQGTGSPATHAFMLCGARRPVDRTQSGSRREEYQRARFDAFPRRRGGGERVVERGMKRQPGAAVIGAVVHPDEQNLVGLHVRGIVPAVR